MLQPGSVRSARKATSASNGRMNGASLYRGCAADRLPAARWESDKGGRKGRPCRFVLPRSTYDVVPSTSMAPAVAVTPLPPPQVTAVAR